MSEVKDPAIKLFGKTIQLPSNDVVSPDLLLLDSEANSDHTSNLSCSSSSVSSKNNTAMDSKQDDNSFNDNEERSDENTSQEKPLKKPDKILPCPRCKSTETKFCYFNNYNVNQPRHFCRGCQRYWTAGGAIRNVPVGSGRRRAKCSLNPHLIDIPDTTNGTIFPTHTLNSDSHHFPKLPCFAASPWFPAAYPVSVYATPPLWGPCNIPLGKHAREGDGMMEESGRNTKVLVPKILRIDDASEAAKSSIWATLGISSSGVFGGFESKGGEVSSGAEGSLVLQANPAAFSRSLRFHESAE